MKNSRCHLLAAGLIAAVVAMPNTGFALGAPPTGTLIGTITCGADEITPAAHIVVAAEGINVQTTTDGGGKFILSNVPAAQPLTIDAVADPEASVVASRFNVVVQAGQTLDIGSIDLEVCGQPEMATPSDQGPPDTSTDN